jgi:arabinan endo-1,5-alpha-L-arabinosidase
VHEGEGRSDVDVPIVILAILLSVGCGGSAGGSSGSGTGGSGPSVFSSYKLAGNTTPVRDPSMFRQGNTYYVFSTDPGAVGIGSITIRCSSDRIHWSACGYVFGRIPAWVVAKVPGVVGLWAPDISYFNGLYHVYYAGSTFGSNTSVIGLATNTTLDPADPAYQWVDKGMVLQSVSVDNFNAIDPTILADNDGSVWLTYGSYWTGIKQRQLDPASGMLLASNATVYALASRPGVQYDPIEGSSLVHKGGYYYLFVSMDFCCMPNPYQDNYKIAVGRGMGPHGPFVDQNGVDMMNGGGTILLQGNGTTWNAPGGETVYLDAQQGDMITFHALSLPTGAAYLFVNSLSWPNGWPQIGP